MSTTYYHFTTTDALPEILKHGLKPSIGARSQMVGETEPRLYLCNHRDIPYWKIILNLPVLLRIKQLDIPNCQYYEYSNCGEYLYTEPIPPNQITVLKANTNACPDNVMKDLCLTYLQEISRLCVTTARYYTYKNTPKNPEWLTETHLKYNLHTLLYILKNLNYSKCTSKELRKELREIGDGGFAFTDRYMYPEYNRQMPQLYTMLIRFEKDDLYPLRHQLYKFITKNFKKALAIDTGGWTG